MSRPTHIQLEVLGDFLEQNPGIAKGILRTAHAKQETKRKWDEVALNLNALGGTQKNGRGWAKYWAEKKCGLKRTCAQHAQSMRHTGGESVESPVLAPLDQRLVAVMGDLHFATGDSHVAVKPCPSTVSDLSCTFYPHNWTSLYTHISQSQNDISLDVIIPRQEDNVDGVLESHDPSIQNEETGRATSPARERSPRPTTRGRSSQRDVVRSRSMLDQDRDRFAEIERQRVEAEIATARAFSRAVEKIQGLSTAIREGSEAMAHGLNNIAEALR